MKDASIPEITLENCSGCGQEMNVSQFEPFARVACPCGAETRVKRTFGNYRLERRYAVGGMSVVFVAWDTTLDREVAVKILNEEYSIDEGRVEQFENEARLTAAVHNPHVVQIYTVGKAYGRFYLVMELLEGQSFEIIMRERGAIPEAEALDIGRQVIEGLQAANNAGVIHRDVKPGNILIDKAGQVKLVDFGLALITKGGKAQADEIWATPYYVPPEVLERGVEDFRSDVYALGATLYHALVGRPPFDATSTETNNLREKKKVLPKLNKAASWLKPSTCEAIDRLMAYEPKNRAGSYREALALIDIAVAEVSEAGSIPIHGQSRAKRRGRRKKVAAMQAGAGVLALAAMWYVGNRLFGEKEPEPVVEKKELAKPGVINPAAVSSQPSQAQTEFLARAWDLARQAVSKRDFRMAWIQFNKIAKNKTVPEPTRSWAELEGITAQLLGGMPGKARESAGIMHRRISKDKSDDPITNTLKRVAETLASSRPVGAEQLAIEPSNIVEWISCLAMTTKNWEQGQLKESIPMLRKIKSADLAGEYEWFSIYRTVISDYLHDGALLSDFSRIPDPANEDEAEKQLMELNSRFSKLKTKGRAKFNVRARQAWLARVKKGFQHRPSEEGGISWENVKSMIEEPIADRDFLRVKSIIQDNESSGSTSARWALEYLSDNAALFLKDFNGKTGFKVLVQGGPEVTVTNVTDEGVTFDNGKTKLWSNLEPTSLLRAHDILREKESGERAAAMLEHGISFAWLCDRKVLAEIEAEKFAASDTTFAGKWRKVIVGVSE